MKTVGIIVEYNPLHNGHVYHFQEAKKVSGADAVVAVMSGHFLQRGEPALTNKWARTEMALSMGADLVIELPVAYCVQPAEWFAFGAVSVLESTGVVDSLCFGSESGEIGWLSALAAYLHNEPQGFHEMLRSQLKKGINYPAAYAAAVAQYISGTANDLQVAEGELAKPNNILGLHYLIALERINSQIEPLTITRYKAGYHQSDINDQQIASATAIRRLLNEKKQLSEAAPFIPGYTFEILRREWESGRAPVDWESFAQPLLAQLLNRSAIDLAQIHEVNEGLEHRIKHALPILKPELPSSIVESLLNSLKTKRYTRTKLQRTLLHILLNHKKDQISAGRLSQGVPYLRILGFSGKGQEVLKKMRKSATVPVVTRISSKDIPFLDLDIRASSVYALAYRDVSQQEMFRDYYQAPIQLITSSKKVEL